MEEALYCSVACMKADVKDSLSSIKIANPCLDEPEEEKSPRLEPHYVVIDYSFGTFNFISAPVSQAIGNSKKSVQASPVTHSVSAGGKRPRMNSIETPPASPAFGFAGLDSAQLKNFTLEPQALYTSLAFNSRKKRF
ncbi:hypothetical protein HDU79_002847 [Rhizoclosmatium sp. JEL0117]|nr:hypothetical protein HDU79_002847 [Rhizoclosmatium sp. JEL0117]